jgi:hypothetical protein
MADAAYRSLSDPFTSMTLGEILNFITYVNGGVKERLTSKEREQYVSAVNNVMALWRVKHRFNGWMEHHTDITWTAGNTREELPLEFAELRPGAVIHLLNTAGDAIYESIECYTLEEYTKDLEDGTHPIDTNDDDDAVALLHGWSVNDKRFLEIRPTPSGGQIYRVPYYSRIDKVNLDSDTLFCAPEVAIGVMFGAAKIVTLVRNPDKMTALAALEESARRDISSPEGREIPRTGRVRPFEGYQKLKYGLSRE